MNVLGCGKLIVIEEDLDGKVNDDSGDGGSVGVREGGYCRIRRRPETPRPCSFSGKIGDLAIESCSLGFPLSSEKRILAAAFEASAKRLPVLRFFGIEMMLGAWVGWGSSRGSLAVARHNRKQFQDSPLVRDTSVILRGRQDLPNYGKILYPPLSATTALFCLKGMIAYKSGRVRVERQLF